MDALLLLEARFVRLVDDDQPEIGIGQEQRRARADRHQRLPLGDLPPRAPPLRLTQPRMPGHRLAPEACGEALEEGLGQRDLGQRSEEHTSELQSLMRISYAVFCLKKKTKHIIQLSCNYHI